MCHKKGEGRHFSMSFTSSVKPLGSSAAELLYWWISPLVLLWFMLCRNLRTLRSPDHGDDSAGHGQDLSSGLLQVLLRHDPDHSLWAVVPLRSGLPMKAESESISERYESAKLKKNLLSRFCVHWHLFLESFCCLQVPRALRFSVPSVRPGIFYPWKYVGLEVPLALILGCEWNIVVFHIVKRKTNVVDPGPVGSGTLWGWLDPELCLTFFIFIKTVGNTRYILDNFHA